MPASKGTNIRHPRRVLRFVSSMALSSMAATTPTLVLAEEASTSKAKVANDFCTLNQDVTPQDYQDILAYADTLGWVKRENLPDELKSKSSPRCDGFYIDRDLNKDKVTTSPTASGLSNAPVSVEADAVKGSTEQDTTLFEGNVVIQQLHNQSRADSACYDKNTNQASLFGNVTLSHSGLRLLGDQAEFNLSRNQGQLHNPLFAIHDAHLRGQANFVDFNFEGTQQQVALEEGYITFCEPSSNAWKLHASDVNLDFEEGEGQASHIRLEIQDVPVFYLPWLNFPLDDRRKTGFLYPSFEVRSGESAIATPFYWNIAPNYDATLTPRYFEHRGAMMEAEFRFLNQWGINTLSGGYLSKDKDYPDSSQTTVTSTKEEDRWSISYQHLGKINHWKTEVDFNRVSDDDYLSDFGGLLSTTIDGTVDQKAKASWAGESLALVTQVRSYQITDEDEVDADQYKLLPDATLTGNWSFNNPKLMPGAWKPSLYLQTSYFERVADEDNLTPTELATSVESAFRTASQLTLNYDLRSSWGFLTPGASLYANHYQIEDRPQSQFNSSDNITVPAAHLHGGLFFDRSTSLMGKSYRQTLEPQFMYTYIPYQNQQDIPLLDTDETDLSFSQLFQANRFNGRDRVGDTSQISLGLSSQLFDTNGHQALIARAGTILYLKDRKIDLSNDHSSVKRNTDNDYDTSNYLGELRYNPVDEWSYQFDLEWSDRLNQTERSSHALLYRPDKEHAATLRYSEKKEALESREEFLEFSAGWQVNPFWTLFHRTEYDLTLDRTSDILNGFEYNNCCWRASLVYRRYYTGDQELISSNGVNELRDEFDSGVFFLIELKGLAGTGGTTDTLLSKLIEGMNRRTIYDY